ncbi:hypothetical protein BLGI_5053 [Brevibacillus laterosporus GI-9]|nr:hypothetical protein BLGI_5053 [Brevibacillus laterosporus GI-9]
MAQNGIDSLIPALPSKKSTDSLWISAIFLSFQDLVVRCHFPKRYI